MFSFVHFVAVPVSIPIAILVAAAITNLGLLLACVVPLLICWQLLQPRNAPIEDQAIAIVTLSGKCESCPLSEMTVKQGIELQLRSEVPEILTVDVWSDPNVAERGFREIVESARLTVED